jgi:predicted PurR-regulated permease PerM
MGQKFFASLVVLAFLYISSPLILPIAMGGVLAVLLYPVLKKMEEKKLSRALSSAILTAGITLVLILPTSLLISYVARSGFEQLQGWKRAPSSGAGLMSTFMDHPRVHSWIVKLTDFIPVNSTDLGDGLQSLALGVGTWLTELLGGVVTHLPSTVMALAIVVVSVYFFLMDGKKLIRFIRKHSVFSAIHTEQLLKTTGEVCRSVILAALVSGGVQAVVELLACVVTGTGNLILIGLGVFLASFVPVIGAVPITFFIAIQQFAYGNQTAAVVLLISAVLLIGIDNTVRPLFLKGSADLHPLLAFVAVFGGLQTLGFLGVFLGPVLAALFMVTIKVLTTDDLIVTDLS